ncbi:hypothetical protein AQUCO_00700788v1 [Aquilegia coerulea]|uniref:Uncharacterized protein n=1 Tax=Aquilegia coerulea TaxID=218851 RepID=A0A2G5ELN0_AQUCA|nr:hypothetical protein AQUCO_00700788v1 [Aquilegia coerulea]
MLECTCDYVKHLLRYVIIHVHLVVGLYFAWVFVICVSCWAIGKMCGPNCMVFINQRHSLGSYHCPRFFWYTNPTNYKSCIYFCGFHKWIETTFSFVGITSLIW